MVTKPFEGSPLAKFVETRVLELQDRKSQAEIAAEAGYTTPNNIAMLKSGATKLALNRVPLLAKALDCDAAFLFRLALQQPGREMTARVVGEIFGAVLTRNEVAWIEEIREVSGNSDPHPTARGRAALGRIFGK